MVIGGRGGGKQCDQILEKVNHNFNQNHNHASLYLQSDIYQNTPKMQKSCEKNWDFCKKIAQSGHTD